MGEDAWVRRLEGDKGMRKIKFRAWDKERKEMIYIEGEAHILINATGYSESISCYIVPATNDVMQYTGLKDKNGKEIYEGDTVKGDFWIGNDIGVVKFGEHSIIVGHDDVLDSSIDTDAYGYYISLEDREEFPLVDTDELEIIGNIYENPELKEVENEH